MSSLRTLPEALAEAARTLEGFCFVSHDREVRLLYRDFLGRATSLAGILIDAGVQPHDLVPFVIADAEWFLTTLFGISLAGAIPAPLSAPLGPGDHQRCLDLLAAVLRSSSARCVLTTHDLQEPIRAARAAGICPMLREVLIVDESGAPCAAPGTLHLAPGSQHGTQQPAPGTQHAALGTPRAGLDDIALVQFTSGSTASPRGVVITHRSLCENIDAINGPSGLASSASDSAVSWLPLYHDMGLIGMALGPLYCGRPAVLMPSSMFVRRPVEWLRAISRYRGTVSFAPCFAYDLCVRRIKESDLDGLDLSCWRVAGCGAEPIHAGTLSAFAGKFARVGFRAASFLPSYGLAEHVLAASFAVRDQLPRVDRILAEDLAILRRATPARSGPSPSQGDRPATLDIVSCGRPLPRHRIAILDNEGRAVPERHAGEITLAGPSVMSGYFRDERSSAEALRDGWLRTGDLGYFADGELFVCGRLKDLIVVHGRKYHPQDLEWALADIPGIRHGRVVAFAASDEPGRSSDRVIVVAESNGLVQPDALAAAIRARIASAHGLYVDEVVVAPGGSISRTTSGKLRRASVKVDYERGILTAPS